MKAKKLLSILLSLAMAVTAFAVNASAADVKTIKSGKTYSASLARYHDTADYKFTSNGSGYLKIKVSTANSWTWFGVMDTSNNHLKPEKVTSNIGSTEWASSSNGTRLYWNEVEKKYSGTLTYKISKGTYYIQLERNGSDNGDNKVTISTTFPSADSSSSDVKINNLTLTMKVGDKIQLGTALSASTDDNVAWKSSKTSVAKVSATGLVTAKAAGTTTITASIGSSTQKIDIKVTK